MRDHVDHRNEADFDSHQQTVYLITNLTRAQAFPVQLLELNRGHWEIETLHHARGRAFSEDRRSACKGRVLRALAWLRTVAVSGLRFLDIRNIAAALRELSADACLVLKVLGVWRTCLPRATSSNVAAIALQAHPSVGPYPVPVRNRPTH